MNASIDDAAHQDPAQLTERSLVWRTLLISSGLVGAVVLAGVAAFLGDLEAAAVSAAFGGFTWLVWRRGSRWGAVGLVLVSAITLFFMSTAAIINLRAGSAISAVALSSVLAAVALCVLVAAFAYLRGNRLRTRIAPAWVAWTVLAAVAVMVTISAATPRTEAVSADIHLVARNVAFSDTELATPAGKVTVVLANEDLFWHTFTIGDLGVELLVPVGAKLPITFEAPAGTYEFVCRIPGHPEAGMKGTLTVAP